MFDNKETQLTTDCTKSFFIIIAIKKKQSIKSETSAFQKSASILKTILFNAHNATEPTITSTYITVRMRFESFSVNFINPKQSM
jgi:hypothetical protein